MRFAYCTLQILERALPRVTEPPDKLLDLIYDAATDERLWTPALIEIADMTGSLGGFLHGVNGKACQITFTFNGRMSEESHRVHVERHIDNPWFRHMNSQSGGEVGTVGRNHLTA